MSSDDNFFYFQVNSTEKLQAKLSLQSCSKYGISVSATEAGHVPETPTNWLRTKTPYSPRQPPKRLRRKANINGTEIIISWEHSCSLKGQQPPYYLVRINDLSLNLSTVVHVSELYYRHNISSGAELQLMISTPTANAVPAVYHYKTPPLPSPDTLHVIATDIDTASYTFSWSPVVFQAEP